MTMKNSMRCWTLLRCPALFVVAAAQVFSQQRPASWRDPCSHSVQFVTVEKGVRLEVLDWGGSGAPVVLLAGGGNTAHVFDEFAPKLAETNHVYGITRRGFGRSGYSRSGNPISRLRDDVLAVLDSLRLKKPVLAGHSIAGAELSMVAISHPERISGVIYLEAGYPYALAGSDGPTMAEFQQIGGPQPPTPRASDLFSFTSLQKWDERVYGFRTPEAEFHQTWDSSPGGRPAKPRDSPGSQLFAAMMTTTPSFRDIPVPALAIFGIPHVQESWMKSTTDPAVREAAATYFSKLDALADRQAKAFEAGVRTARVVRLTGMHYIFLSNQQDVLREMRAFLASLK
jgi:pimeloyl-ACP methyl ester carboxylesterase